MSQVKLSKAESRMKFRRDLLYILLLVVALLNFFLPISDKGLGIKHFTQWLVLLIYIKTILGFLSYGKQTIPFASMTLIRLFQMGWSIHKHTFNLPAFIIVIVIDVLVFSYLIYFRSAYVYVVKKEEDEIDVGGDEQ